MASESSKATVTIVLPFVNMEAQVLPLIEEVRKHITTMVPGSDIVAVDGRSTDHTWDVLREMAQVFNDVRVFRTRNTSLIGQCGVRGFFEAQGHFIFYMEPHSPWGANTFWALAKFRAESGARLVVTGRPAPRRSMKERLMMRLYGNDTVAKHASFISDPASPMLFFSRDDFERISILLSEDTMLPTMLLQLLFQTAFDRVDSLTPEDSFLVGTSHIPIPDVFRSANQARACFQQLGALSLNLSRIKGLVAF